MAASGAGSIHASMRIAPPFRVQIFWVGLPPGRCPGLVCVAPLGLDKSFNPAAAGLPRVGAKRGKRRIRDLLQGGGFDASCRGIDEFGKIIGEIARVFGVESSMDELSVDDNQPIGAHFGIARALVPLGGIWLEEFHENVDETSVFDDIRRQ